ncbi:unnamed protein product, partial [Allacma fusca]
HLFKKERYYELFQILLLQNSTYPRPNLILFLAIFYIMAVSMNMESGKPQDYYPGREWLFVTPAEPLVLMIRFAAAADGVTSVNACNEL